MHNSMQSSNIIAIDFVNYLMVITARILNHEVTLFKINYAKIVILHLEE